MKQGIPRKSAKIVLDEYAQELLARGTDPSTQAKLLALETVAYRMNWSDLYNKLRYRKSQKAEGQPEKWWDK